MADELKTNEDLLEEGYTEFQGPTTAGGGPFFYPTGILGRFFAKFFATKAAPAIAREIRASTYDGDTIVKSDVVKIQDPPGPSMLKTTPKLPDVEYARKNRYKDYEVMDEYPEIGAAFDIYADDCTQAGIKDEIWNIKSASSEVIEEIEKLFKTIEIRRFLWDVVRNTVKFGDCFIELVVDLEDTKAGVQRIKVLDPKYIIRVENEYGYLTDFLQEIPEKGSNDNMSGFTSPVGAAGIRYITLDKHQILHFRLHTSDPVFYPYGKSIAALCHRVFRSLRLMEDAMLIYRLSRAPERRIFYIDVGNLPSSKAEMYIERLKEKFKKEKFYDTGTDSIDARYNPMSQDEDFFVPMRGGSGTKIETLKGAENLGEVDDVKYFRDKLLAALKVPKDYIVEKDQSPERKANLSQLDVKFARTILRIQRSIEIGLESICKRHLQLKGFPASLFEDFHVRLPEPSDMFAKRKLDLDEQKTRVVQAVMGLGLFPKETIYEEYFNMTEDEIDRIKKKVEAEQKALMDQADAGLAEGGGAPGGAIAPGAAGGQESAENVPPPTNEDTIKDLALIKKDILSEEKQMSWKVRAIDRVLKKAINKSKEAEIL